MSCGFGAVVLLFLIIKHQADVKVEIPQYNLSAERGLLEQEIGDAKQRIGDLLSKTEGMDADIALAQDHAGTAINGGREATPRASMSAEIAALKAAIKHQKTEKRRLQQQIHEKSRNVRTFSGEGNREYLTGIQLGGQRILILLDASASMLDETIVNVIRRRNMDDAAKRRSAKWQQALATVDWISARFPQQSQYQIYTFNTKASPVLSGTRGRWLPVSNTNDLDRAIDEVRQTIPEGGSSLENAFLVITQLNPRPDNIYLITDGLPTQGRTPPRRATVSGRERLRHFEEAMTQIPRGIPVNVILLPMEGDPMAPSAFWQIALYTRGAFLSPAADWP